MTETSHDTEYPRVQIALLSEVFTLQGKMEKTGCKIISGAPTTLSVKGLMMMMMMTSSPRWFNEKIEKRESNYIYDCKALLSVK